MPTIAEAHLDDTQRVHECLITTKKQELFIDICNVIHEDVVGDSLRLQNFCWLERDVFTCEDNGYGMTPEFVQRLFVPFERAEDERLKGIQGTGLGMVITKNILRMMIQPLVRALP